MTSSARRASASTCRACVAALVAERSNDRPRSRAILDTVDGDRPTRIRSHVETRALACEKWLPLWRIIVGLDQPELKQRIALARYANIERMKLMYGPELSALAEPEREQLLWAMVTLISFESWDQLRHCFGLSIEAAQAVWRSAIDRMLPTR